MKDLIQELLVTIENELNNRRDWSFGGRKVRNAETQENHNGQIGLLITMDDNTDIVLTTEVLEP